MSTLALEAASIAVQAPIAVPEDMDELPSARTRSPVEERRGHPQGRAGDASADLRGEPASRPGAKLGSRYPDARTGGVQASVITGKGVEALLGTFDSQIKGAQMIFKSAFEQSPPSASRWTRSVAERPARS
jgi:hypothetical protein